MVVTLKSGTMEDFAQETVILGSNHFDTNPIQGNAFGAVKKMFPTLGFRVLCELLDAPLRF